MAPQSRLLGQSGGAHSRMASGQLMVKDGKLIRSEAEGVKSGTTELEERRVGEELKPEIVEAWQCQQTDTPFRAAPGCSSRVYPNKRKGKRFAEMARATGIPARKRTGRWARIKW